jgi:ribosome-associated protein
LSLDTMANESSEPIKITRKLAIPASELEFRFSRSGGPGGQNVNRRETRVELLFDVEGSPTLSEKQRKRLLKRLAKQIDGDGVLHIAVQTHRSQLRNRQEAVERFVAALQRAMRKRKRRLPTKAPAQAKEQRLATKRKRSEIKKKRKGVDSHDSS